MAKRKKTKIAHAESVRLFAARLREVRLSRGMTQAELAHKARVSEAYIGRLERAEGAPGIDLVARLAQALGTTSADLLPTTAPPDTLAALKDQAKQLFDHLLQTADRETPGSLPLAPAFLDREDEVEPSSGRAHGFQRDAIRPRPLSRFLNDERP